MSLSEWLFGRKKLTQQPLPERIEVPEYPWDRSPSIYQHIRANIESGDGDLPPDGQKLPDEEGLAAKATIMWAAGAMDGVGTHHMGAGDNSADVAELFRRVEAYWKAPTVRNKARVYEFVVEKGTLALADALIERLSEHKSINHQRLYELARSFATDSPDREPVKFGIVLLGLFHQPSDLAIFRTLGRHDEFTLFCAVALANVAENAERELWQLAKHVHGWGRIHLVERLAQTDDADIKSWLLREGFKNDVLYEYLAYTCATTGGLLAALTTDGLDDALLDGASHIIRALIAGGPAESIDDYGDAEPVIEHYLRHVAHRGKQILHFLTVADIKGYVSDDTADWTSREDRGWTADKRTRVREECDGIIRRESWPDAVAHGLRSKDELTFHNASAAARVLGIATWQVHWDRLCQAPLDSGRWYAVMEACDDKRIDGVVKLAEDRLPLDEIAAGPGTEMGLGPQWLPHSCLDFILQSLDRFPGKGARLVEAGLRSPVVRNRNMALKALAGWGKERWPAAIENSLRRAVDVEPVEAVRENMRRLLAGEPLDWDVKVDTQQD